MQRGNLAPSRLPEVEPGLDAAEDSNTDISHSLQVTPLLLLQPQIRQCPSLDTLSLDTQFSCCS